MTVFFVVTYDVIDPETYAKYNPGMGAVVGQTIAKHGGTLLAASDQAYDITANAQMKVIIQFPNKDAALAWHDDHEYASAKKIRLSSTKNTQAFIVDTL